MNKFKIGLDNFCNKSKPNSYNARSIKERVAESIRTVSLDNLKSFVSLVGKDGRTFSPATFKTTFEDLQMSRNNFQQMQLFVLDFNGGISFDEVMSRARQYDLPILFAYETFSNKNQDRFRVVFLNDTSIKYVKVAEIMSEALLTIFPEADPRSENIAQIYFGGKQILHFDELVPTINIELLFRNMCLYLRNRYGNKHYKSRVYRFSELTGLALNDKKMLDVSIVKIMKENSKDKCNDVDGTLSPNYIIHIIELGDKSPFRRFDTSKLCYKIKINNSTNQSSSEMTSFSDKKLSKIHKHHRSSDLRIFGLECQLLKAFKDGAQILNQDELFGLSTNLIQIETGSDKFMNILKQHSYFESNPNKYSDWEFHLSYMKKNEYISQPCDWFCPYSNQCHHAEDILSTAKPKQHTTKKLANCDKKYYDIDEALADFKQKYATAMDTAVTMYNNIHVINASAGIGKSTTVMNDMKKNPDLKYLFASPTIDLKNKFYNEAISKGIKAVKSPSLLESKDKLPTNVWNRIQGFYQIGKHHAVMDYIKEIITKKEVNKDTLDILENYRKDLTTFYASNCHAFTTHSILSTMDYWTLKKYDAVIIDEDPILNYMIANQVEIPISMLEKALDEIDSSSRLAKKIRVAVKAAATESWFALPGMTYDEAYEGISTAIDIPSFCLAEKFYHKKKGNDKHLSEKVSHEDSIVFFKPFKLDHRIKYIILSATADEKIYNYFFGAKSVQFYECKKAKNIGTLNQYTRYPMSRSFVEAKPDVVKKMIKLSGFDNILTFKGEEYGLDDCHFGKTTGIDKYKGKDLTVLGTYHRPDWLYKLFVYTVGWNLFDEYKDAVMCYQLIRHKGFKFYFMTFNESAMLLRDIQLWMIESESEQAVGRPRLSRCDCTVNLFSNLPLSQANIMDNFDYDKD